MIIKKKSADKGLETLIGQNVETQNVTRDSKSLSCTVLYKYNGLSSAKKMTLHLINRTMKTFILHATCARTRHDVPIS